MAWKSEPNVDSLYDALVDGGSMSIQTLVVTLQMK
jgi:hypothetical protein